MKVMYDISVLGKGFYIPRSRTGIFRVIEELAQELVKEQVISSFSSYPKLGDYFQCSDYLMNNENLAGVQLAMPNINETMLKNFHYLYQQTYLKITIRLLIRVLNKTISSTIKGNFLNYKELAISDIYHSPFYPIPEQVRKLKHIKKVITVYDLIPMLHPQFFRFNKKTLIAEVLKSIDENTWVTCISHATKNDLCNYLPSLDPSRVFVTHLAASALFYPCQDQPKIEAIKTKFGIPDGSYMLSLSTLEPRKNIIQTIKCFARLVEEEAIKDISLVLVGTKGWDFEPIFNEIAINSKIRDKIIVTGYVPDEYLAPLYSGAMMFVYPSFYEGFGLPPLEAMQCGTPVITSNTSSLPEVVGDAGIMVDPNDRDALCQAMLDIYNSSELRQKMSANSLVQAQQFSWKKCAEQTIDAYKAAIIG